MSRGLGKIEQRLMEKLSREQRFDPVEIYPAPITPAQYQAINRATHSLQRKGLADCHYVWGRNTRGNRTVFKWIFQKGATPDDVGVPHAMCGYDVRAALKCLTRLNHAGSTHTQEDDRRIVRMGSMEATS
jgi:hypothetical protein